MLSSVLAPDDIPNLFRSSGEVQVALQSAYSMEARYATLSELTAHSISLWAPAVAHALTT
jgi:hypothetical protein